MIAAVEKPLQKNQQPVRRKKRHGITRRAAPFGKTQQSLHIQPRHKMVIAEHTAGNNIHKKRPYRQSSAESIQTYFFTVQHNNTFPSDFINYHIPEKKQVFPVVFFDKQCRRRISFTKNACILSARGYIIIIMWKYVDRGQSRRESTFPLRKVRTAQSRESI